MSLPLVVNEDQATVFNFYYEGQIYQGIFFENELYMHVRLFSEVGRLKAYALADYLQDKAKVLIVVSKIGYRIGVALRSGIKPLDAMQIAYDLEQSISSLGSQATAYQQQQGGRTPGNYKKL